MHELVYVSSGKLRQIVNELPKRTGRIRDIEGEIKTPVGGIKLGRQAKSREPNLAEAVRLINNSSRAPKYFTEADLENGSWVYFEAPLSHRAADHSVIFLDDDRPSDTYPTGGQIRLLLHGSRQYLVGDHPINLDDNIPNLPPSSSWVTFGEYLIKTIEDNENVNFKPHRGKRSTATSAWIPYGSDKVDHGIEVLSEILHVQHAAAWMAGLARITAIFDLETFRLVAASPLYVEYTTPPSPSDLQ